MQFSLWKKEQRWCWWWRPHASKSIPLLQNRTLWVSDVSSKFIFNSPVSQLCNDLNEFCHYLLIPIKLFTPFSSPCFSLVKKKIEKTKEAACILSINSNFQFFVMLVVSCTLPSSSIPFLCGLCGLFAEYNYACIQHPAALMSQRMYFSLFF